jgi:flagella basal body P-ring formation protein FlgA
MNKFKFSFFLLCLLPVINFANEFVDPERLKQLTQQFLTSQVEVFPGEQLEIDVNNIDSNLKLSQCAQPIDFRLPTHSNFSGTTTVEVSCSTPQKWTIYIPATIKIYTDVIVTTRNISKGETFSVDDIDYQTKNRNRLIRGYFTTPEKIIGMLAKRNLPVGSVISQRHLTLPTIIRRNQTVTIIAHTGTVAVEVKGVAKKEGRLNDIIRVMNTSSKRIIQGKVIAPGVVEAL